MECATSTMSMGGGDEDGRKSISVPILYYTCSVHPTTKCGMNIPEQMVNEEISE